ncbi:hypothetical protein BDN70DRAFT_918996 [Pholiota conissans]|uniref:Heterokaryon incompatibility domain-containing protein n=1 Tax=Pholiota conissans TaxID=109636 RepID=A0A9P5Z9F1_9AGAR|nr:hypothetical protein BDN70DRAFT_918996 [Pholiota conissans]
MLSPPSHSLSPQLFESSIPIPIDYSSSMHSQALLAALQNLITPLVRSIVSNPQNVGENQLGSEGEEFLIALQRYISSFVQQEQLESTTNGNLPVDIVGAEKGETGAIGTDTEAGQNEMSGVPLKPVELEQTAVEVKTLPAIPLQANDSRIIHEALMDLRAKVFNEMPIHLLRFRKHGLDLDITLIDRAQVYSLLAQNLEREARNSDFAIDILLKPEKMINDQFEDWQRSNFDRTQAGYQKIVNFCKVAMDDHGLTLGWMDTVCIDKSSSSELDESIRSMYKWGFNELFPMHVIKFEVLRSEKFLQCPSTSEPSVLFHMRKGGRLRKQKIEAATTLTKLELLYSLSDSIPIYRKMQWAAMRQVTREEDIAYSLMGIFKINMSIAYGEGAKFAFLRLLKEILNNSKANILDVFNWAGDYQSDVSGLLPYSPRAYLQCFTPTYYIPRLIEPLSLSHRGLRIPGLLIPAIPVEHLSSATAAAASKGDFHATVSLNISVQQNIPLLGSLNVLEMTGITKIRILDKRVDDRPQSGRKWAFLISNCDVDEMNIYISGLCFAVLISWAYIEHHSALPPIKYKIQTGPVNWRLNHRTRSTVNGCYSIKQSDLPEQGMQYLTVAPDINFNTIVAEVSRESYGIPKENQKKMAGSQNSSRTQANSMLYECSLRKERKNNEKEEKK